MNNQKTQYKIIQAKTLEEIEKETIALVEQGWQPAGPVTEIKSTKASDNRFYHEMVRFVVNTEEQQKMEQTFIT